MTDSSIWLALMIGNSRLHWAWFRGENLQQTWDTPHLPADVVKQLAQGRTLADLFRETMLPVFPTPLYLASVVPSQTALWQTYPDVQVVTLEQVPLQDIYPSLGIDRALALWGAGETWGWPMLVIDAGTALTLTGADGDRCFVGGAILPGVSLQVQSLAARTAGLSVVDLPENLPPRWALNTQEAIQSGVIYTTIAGIRDFVVAWWQQFPHSGIALTGGDRTLLLTYLQAQFPAIAAKVISDGNLIFWGMRSCCNSQDKG